ncbi:MAG TPA: hypothetical protein VFY95_06345 [Sphingomicrobium sp.]
MTPPKDFTPQDFVQLVKELNEHEAELKIKLAQAGVKGAEPRTDQGGGKPA